MKFKHVIISLGLAAVLGLGIGASLKTANVKEAKADRVWSDAYYIVGGMNSWSQNEDYKLTFDHDVDNNWQFTNSNPISIAKDQEFLIRRYYNDGFEDYRPPLMTPTGEFGYGVGNPANMKANRNIEVTFYFQLTKYNYDWIGLYWAETYTTAQPLANAFGTTFLAETADYCSKAVIDESSLKEAYDALGSAKFAFYDQTVIRGKGMSYDNTAQEALSRYVNMQEEKEYTDFLDLGEHNPLPSSKSLISIYNSGDNGTSSIIALSVVSLLGLAGFFFVVRRKEVK